MVELGELEARHEEFEKRNFRIIVVANDDRPTSLHTQSDFPHLRIVSDVEQNVSKALQVLHRGMGPEGSDTNMPITFVVDGSAVVRSWFQEENFIARTSPETVLRGIDRVTAQ